MKDYETADWPGPRREGEALTFDPEQARDEQREQAEGAGLWDDAELVSAYSRAQAIEDGDLVDVSSTAAEAGFVYPVAVTRAIWTMIEAIPDTPRGFGQSIRGRLWDVVYMARMYCKLGKGDPRYMAVIMDVKGSRKRKQIFKIEIGPGDTPEPVITIMLPDED